MVQMTKQRQKWIEEHGTGSEEGETEKDELLDDWLGVLGTCEQRQQEAQDERDKEAKLVTESIQRQEDSVLTFSQRSRSRTHNEAFPDDDDWRDELRENGEGENGEGGDSGDDEESAATFQATEDVESAHPRGRQSSAGQGRSTHTASPSVSSSSRGRGRRVRVRTARSIAATSARRPVDPMDRLVDAVSAFTEAAVAARQSSVAVTGAGQQIVAVQSELAQLRQDQQEQMARMEEVQDGQKSVLTMLKLVLQNQQGRSLPDTVRTVQDTPQESEDDN